MEMIETQPLFATKKANYTEILGETSLFLIKTTGNAAADLFLLWTQYVMIAIERNNSCIWATMPYMRNRMHREWSESKYQRIKQLLRKLGLIIDVKPLEEDKAGKAADNYRIQVLMIKNGAIRKQEGVKIGVSNLAPKKMDREVIKEVKIQTFFSDEKKAHVDCCFKKTTTCVAPTTLPPNPIHKSARRGAVLDLSSNEEYNIPAFIELYRSWIAMWICRMFGIQKLLQPEARKLLNYVRGTRLSIGALIIIYCRTDHSQKSLPITVKDAIAIMQSHNKQSNLWKGDVTGRFLSDLPVELANSCCAYLYCKFHEWRTSTIPGNTWIERRDNFESVYSQWESWIKEGRGDKIFRDQDGPLRDQPSEFAATE